MEFKKLVKISSFVIFFIIIAYYLLTNLGQVTFNYFPGRDLSVPLGLLALGIMLVGFVMALIYQLPYQFSLKRQLRLISRKLTLAEDQVNKTMEMIEIVSSENKDKISKSLSQLKKRSGVDVTSTYLYLRALLLLEQNDEFFTYYDSLRGTELVENYLIASLVAKAYLRKGIKISALDTLLKHKKVMNRSDMTQSLKLALELKEVAKATEIIEELESKNINCDEYLDYLHCITFSNETNLKECIKSKRFFPTFALLVARSNIDDKLFYLEEAARITERVDFVLLALFTLLEEMSVDSDIGRLERARILLSNTPSCTTVSTFLNIIAVLLDESIDHTSIESGCHEQYVGRFDSITYYLSEAARRFSLGQVKEGKESLLKIFSLANFREIFQEQLISELLADKL